MTSTAPLSPIVRMAPLQMGELPDHASFQQSEGTTSTRPDLIPFLLGLLDAGNDFIDSKSFNIRFKPNSKRPAPPSNTNVEVLTYSAPVEELDQIQWDDTKIAGFQRSRPRHLQAENWFARRSYHENVSVKTNPSTACWDEFVYGLRDEHSKHEFDFTPTLYDAHHILDWNREVGEAAAAGHLTSGSNSYSNVTLAVYEMCHAIPFPLHPRCFPVLVATASTSQNRFIAVTVPVNLMNFKGAFYSTGRNKVEGQDAQMKKEVVLGVYTAVEAVSLHNKSTAAGEVVEWIMATASDAKGNVPMFLQKSSMPGAVVKDVGYFLKWIKTVDSTSVHTQKSETHTARGSLLRSVRNSIASIEEASVLPSALPS